MANLIVTPSLINDISLLSEELKIKSDIEKITFEEFKSENNITLFENDNPKFIYDKYVSYAELNKMNFNFNENYIFQVKKQNLSKFSNESEDIKVHYLEPEKEKEIFPWDFTKILFSSKIQLQSEIVDHFCINENYIFQIKKQNLSKFSNENSEINVHYIEQHKAKEIFPWDFTKILFSSKIQLQSEIVDHFCINENTFKQFLSYFHKELIRLKLTFLYSDDEISNVLVEKIDYKYQLARERKSKHNIEDIDKCLENIYKIEKLILESGFNSENAKRFIVSSKSLLQF